jgi:uncharacterized protein involved in response to NO
MTTEAKFHITEPGLQKTLAAPKGFALFNYGFRPFFLLGSIFGMAALAYFICLLTDHATYLPSYFDPISWHRHEMIFGYTIAIIVGFLFTAIPNWTGNPTPKGIALAAIVLLWLAGRVAVFFAADLPSGISATIDVLFLPVCAIAVAPALLKARNRRNYGFPALLLLLAASNLAVHLDAIGVWENVADRAIYFALGIIIVIMVVIGGRVIPLFTERPLGISIPSSRAIDSAVILSVVMAITAELLFGQGQTVALLSLLATACILLRMRSWQTLKTLQVPLLWILHAGYLWLAIGFALKTGSYVTSAIPLSLSTHAFTAGAIGSLTLGMMSRVSLGHTGRQMIVGRTMTAAFVSISLVAILRVFAVMLLPAYTQLWLILSMALWILAFSLFLLIYAPILIHTRVDGREG